MEAKLKIWVKFTGKCGETHRYVCEDAREALAIQVGCDMGLPMEDLHAFADACVDIAEMYDGPVPYVYIMDMVATEMKAQSAGGAPTFDIYAPKEAARFIAGTLI